MVIQAEKKTSPTISPQSIMLAKQARMEHRRYGHISVLCPNCHEHPSIMTTPNGERTIVSCPCGYVISAEINF